MRGGIRIKCKRDTKAAGVRWGVFGSVAVQLGTYASEITYVRGQACAEAFQRGLVL